MGVLKKITDEYFGDIVREDEGVKVTIGGNEYILKFKDYPFAGDLSYFENGDMFVEFSSRYYGDQKMYDCYRRTKGQYGTEIDIHYVISEKSLKETVNKVIAPDSLKKTAVTYNGYNPVEDSYLPLYVLSRALTGTDIDEIDFDQQFTISKEYHGYFLENVMTYGIFVTEDVAQEAAIQDSLTILKTDNPDFMKKWDVEEKMKVVGDSWILMDNVKDLYREQRVSYYESEGMDADEIEDIVDKEMEKETDFLVKVMEKENGCLPNECYDMEKLAELCVKVDGRGHYLSSYNSEEYMCEIDDVEYYVYIN